MPRKYVDFLDGEQLLQATDTVLVRYNDDDPNVQYIESVDGDTAARYLARVYASGIKRHLDGVSTLPASPRRPDVDRTVIELEYGNDGDELDDVAADGGTPEYSLHTYAWSTDNDRSQLLTMEPRQADTGEQDAVSHVLQDLL